MSEFAYDLLGYVPRVQLQKSDIECTVHLRRDCPMLGDGTSTLVPVRTCDGPHVCRRCGSSAVSVAEADHDARALPRVPERPPMMKQSATARRLDPVLGPETPLPSDD